MWVAEGRQGAILRGIHALHEANRFAPDVGPSGRVASIREFLGFIALATALFLFPSLIPSLINGFPLIHDDTGACLPSGVDRSSPRDRPVIYGLFALPLHE